MNVTAVAESAGLLAEIAGLLAEKNVDLPLLLQQKKTQKLAYASSTKNADLLVAENADAMVPSSVENAAVLHTGQPSAKTQVNLQPTFAALFGAKNLKFTQKTKA